MSYPIEYCYIILWGNYMICKVLSGVLAKAFLVAECIQTNSSRKAGNVTTNGFWVCSAF